MGAANVIFLDNFQAQNLVDVPTQLDLFGQAPMDHRLFCFLDVNDISQDILMTSIVRNAIDTIVDLRPVPVFSKPKFDHHEITSWFSLHGVSYLEYAFAVFDPVSFAEMDRQYIKSQRTSRLSVWIYDDLSKELGWFEKVRFELRNSFSGAEITARSLIQVATQL